MTMRMCAVFITGWMGLSFGCGSEAPDPSSPMDETRKCVDAPCKLTIIHTNDTHGRFWRNHQDEYGMSAQKTLIDRMRQQAAAQGSEVLVLSGGDINTGVPESDLQHAKPDFTAMNVIGFDAMAVGNHEFDNGIDIIEMQRSWSDFPWLAANIYDKATNRPYFERYKIFTLQNGLRVAVVGLTTTDTARVAAGDVTAFDFRPPTPEAEALLTEIRDQDEADVTVAITHMGHYLNGMHGSHAPGDVSMARNLTAGLLDVIIGGHSQNPVCLEQDLSQYNYPDGRPTSFVPSDACVPDQQNGTYIMQAYEWGKYVGRAEFSFQNGVFTLLDYDLFPVNLRNTAAELVGNDANQDGIPDDENVKIYHVKDIRPTDGELYVEGTSGILEDPDLLSELQPYQANGAAELEVVIATVDGKLEGDRSVVRSQQTNLGRLIATAQSEALMADIGIVNGGSVRDSIPAGEISYRDVLTVQPFGKTIHLVSMSGSELETYLSSVATLTSTGNNGGYPQFAGIEMQVDCTAKTVEITAVGGAPYDRDATYSLTLSSFNAEGGDGYPAVSGIDSGLVDAAVLRDYLYEVGTVQVASYAPGDDIVFINADPTVTTGCL